MVWGWSPVLTVCAAQGAGLRIIWGKTKLFLAWVGFPAWVTGQLHRQLQQYRSSYGADVRWEEERGQLEEIKQALLASGVVPQALALRRGRAGWLEVPGGVRCRLARPGHPSFDNWTRSVSRLHWLHWELARLLTARHPHQNSYI